LIDTNILVYAYNVDSPFHEKAKRVIQKAVKGEIPPLQALRDTMKSIIEKTSSS
jgi:predicted nucleic acid-binding protein